MIDGRVRERLNSLADSVRADALDSNETTEVALWLLVLAEDLKFVGFNTEGEATFALQESKQ